MMTGYGVSGYDHSSMEKYGNEAVQHASTRQDMAASSSSQVIGLQSMFKAHRREMETVLFN